MSRLSQRLALSVVLFLTCSTTRSQPSSEASSKYGIIPEAVERVEILYFPERILTRIGFTPEMLEGKYEFKVEIRDFPASLQREQLVPMLREASFLPSPRRSYDLRTAVILFDKSGNRMLSLYFDRSGRNGVVNRESVSTNDVVYRWAKSMMKGFAD
jgi:hypothetical protein